MQKLHKSDILRGAKPIDPRNPCIYFLVNSDEIVYVGFSESVMSRIHRHLIDKKFDSYFIQKMNDPVEGLIFERYYIELFQPIYNFQYTSKPKKPMNKRGFLRPVEKPIVSRETFEAIELKPCIHGVKVSGGMYTKIKRDDNHYLILNIGNKLVSAEYIENAIYIYEGVKYKAIGFFGSIDNILLKTP